MRVAICTVTHDDADQLDGYFAALRRLAERRDEIPRDVEVVLVDCASTDGSPQILQRGAQELEISTRAVALEENLGFSGGMNVALSMLSPGTDAVLALNPDARLVDDALARLCGTLGELSRSGIRVGAVTGRLLRPRSATASATLDACGMRLALSWRHFDRGSGEPDDDRYRVREEVFGGTGAGTLYALEALRDVAVDGEVFDERFHSFREDAELAFRLQERGWRTVFEPLAVIVHRRVNLPNRRRALSATVNYHSLKNRYLLRLFHQHASNWLWTGVAATLRDLGILTYVLLRERSSLAAYRWLWRERRELLAHRRRLISRQTASRSVIERWFFFDNKAIATPPSPNTGPERRRARK